MRLADIVGSGPGTGTDIAELNTGSAGFGSGIEVVPVADHLMSSHSPASEGIVATHIEG